jgi:hypothetical protein
MRIAQITPTNDTLWRIDFFGYINYNDKQGRRRSQPVIEVWLSKVATGLTLHPLSKEFNSKSISDHGNQTSVEVPITYLLILRIGQIWKNEQLYLTPNYKELHLNNVLISDDTSYPILCGEKDLSEQGVAFSSYFIPTSHHPYHQRCTKTSAEVVEHNGRKYIFPHVVLIQAYFQMNAWAFSQLFQFGLHLDTLFYPQNTYLRSEREAVIQLRPKVKGISAPTIARIAFNEWAQKAALMISDSLALQETNNWKKAPKTRFPFVGKTNLVVRGKFVPENFIVYEILSCSSEFPFDSLDYYRDNAGKVENPSSNILQAGSEGKSTYAPPRISAAENFRLTPQDEPALDLGELDIELDNALTTNLSGLANISVERCYNPENLEPFSSAKGHIKFIEVTSGNTGEYKSGGSGSKVDLSPDVESKKRFVFPEKINRLELFRDVIRHLESDPDVTNLRLISINGHLGNNPQYSYFPASYTEKNRQRTWRYTDKQCSKEHLRRAISVEFSFKKYQVYLVEVERRIEYQKEKSGWVELDDTATLMMISENEKYLSSNMLKTLFRECSDKSGIWQSRQEVNTYTKYQSFNTISLKHPPHEKASLDCYASDFSKYILKKITD